MSFRIEDADPLALLSELPDGLAQTCITCPPATPVTPQTAREVAAVVLELARVTRPDGTLLWSTMQPWLPLRDVAVIFALAGWQLQQSNLATAACHLLFAKQPGHYWHPTTPAWRPSRPLSRPFALRPARRGRPSCIPVSAPAEHAVLGEDMERLLLATTSRRACGVCGAAWAPAGGHVDTPHGPLQPTCRHRDRSGRCLVLDPFHRPGSATGLAAARYGRSYLATPVAREIGARAR